jgi:protein O-GlcNAc transferase
MRLATLAFTLMLIGLVLGERTQGAQDLKSAEARLDQGIAQLRAGNFRQAREELKAAVGLNPKLAAAHLYLGVAENQLGNVVTAIPHFREALRLEPNSDAAHYNLALSLLRTGKNEEAIRELQDAVRLNPHLSDARYNLGLVLSQAGRFHEAVPHLEAAKKNKPRDFAVLVHLARAYLGSKESARAIELLAPFRSQSIWQVHSLLGLAYVDTAQPVAAMQELRKAIRLKSDEASPRYSLGVLLLKSSDLSDQREGADQLRKAIDLAPGEADYYISLSRWLLQQKALVDVVALLRQGIRRVPPSVDLYLMLGLAEAQVHGADVARPLIEKAVEMNPQIAPAFSLLGNCYFRLGEYASAVKYYGKAAEIDLQNGLYQYDLALALERLNRVAEAVVFGEKAVQLNPGRGSAHYLLGKLYAKLNRNDEAVREFETCVKLEPTLDYPYYQLARSYMKMRDSAKAQEWNAKLMEVKAAKDRQVGLAGPASDLNLLESAKPWETESPSASPLR